MIDAAKIGGMGMTPIRHRCCREKASLAFARILILLRALTNAGKTPDLCNAILTVSGRDCLLPPRCV
jgi:hypothetical protein